MAEYVRIENGQAVDAIVIDADEDAATFLAANGYEGDWKHRPETGMDWDEATKSFIYPPERD